MQLGTLAVIVALAAGSTMFWALFEKRVPFMSLTSFILWLYAGFNALSVEHGTQVVVEYRYPMLQYIFYFLALINIALFLLYVWMANADDEDPQNLLSQI